MNAIKLKQGRTALTAGTINTPKNTLCHVAGDIDVTWASNGATTTVPGVVGALMNLYDVESVTIVSGTWTFE